MSSLVEKGPTIFNPARKFAFTNITEEDFVSAWNGTPITIKAGQTVELPHHLANKMVDELVDKIMIGEAKLDEVAMLEKNPSQPLPRSNKGMSLGVPAVRKVWEDKIVKELVVDPEEPQFKILASQVKAELEADMSREPGGDVSNVVVNKDEFADLTKK